MVHITVTLTIKKNTCKNWHFVHWHFVRMTLVINNSYAPVNDPFFHCYHRDTVNPFKEARQQGQTPACIRGLACIQDPDVFKDLR